jgi:hypothetical protein
VIDHRLESRTPHESCQTHAAPFGTDAAGLVQPLAPFPYTVLCRRQLDPRSPLNLYAQPFDTADGLVLARLQTLHSAEVIDIRIDPTSGYPWALVAIAEQGMPLYGWVGGGSNALDANFGCDITSPDANNGATVAAPPALYANMIDSGGHDLRTRNAVGEIGLGEAVRAVSITLAGYQWVYQVRTIDERVGFAREQELMPAYSGMVMPTLLAPSMVPSMAPPAFPTSPPSAPTPTALYNGLMGQGVTIYALTTLVSVGSINAGELVRVSSAFYSNGVWQYNIATQDNRTATAFEYQLTLSSGTPVLGPT